MYFANPWGLFALVAIPAIVVVHLYHRRFPPLVVAGLHLWTSETRQNRAGRRREKLPLSASLIIELVAALLLAIVLGEPRFGKLANSVHLVAILDNSASMAGKPPGDGAVSFRDAAIQEIDRHVASLPRGSVVTLIVTGNRPAMLAGPAVAWRDAKPRLDDWRPQAPRHSFEPAWDLGLQLVEQSGRLLFLTDKLPEETGAAGPALEGSSLPDRMECVSVGRRLDNLAISAARWSFDAASGRGHVFIRVQNHSARPTNFEVLCRSGRRSIFRRPGNLAGQAAASFEAEVPGGLGRLTVELAAADDGLALDNRVELIEPGVRTVTAAISLPQAEAARHVRKVLDALPDVQYGEPASAQLAFAPAGAVPESNVRRWWAGIGPISTNETDLETARDLIGPYTIDKRQPLLDGVVLSGVVWGGVQPVAYDVTPLVSAGNTPLLSRLNGTRTVGFLFNVDLSRSNLAESPDWPILLANLIELRRDALPGLARWNYRLGEEVRFRLFEGDGDGSAASGQLTLRHAQSSQASDSRTGRSNSGRPRSIARTTIVELPLLDEAGVYEVADGENLIGRFAVNFFDTAESDLQSLVPGRRAAKTAEAGSIALDNPYSWLIATLVVGILGAVLADWAVLRRTAA